MKYKALDRFRREFNKLPAEHRARFQTLITEFNRACEEYQASSGAYIWPAKLRVSQLANTKGIFEMTWSFTGPDGRATFHFGDIDGEIGVYWRRVGDHGIYKEP